MRRADLGRTAHRPAAAGCPRPGGRPREGRGAGGGGDRTSRHRSPGHDDGEVTRPPPPPTQPFAASIPQYSPFTPEAFDALDRAGREHRRGALTRRATEYWGVAERL